MWPLFQRGPITKVRIWQPKSCIETKLINSRVIAISWWYFPRRRCQTMREHFTEQACVRCDNFKRRSEIYSCQVPVVDFQGQCWHKIATCIIKYHQSILSDWGLKILLARSVDNRSGNDVKTLESQAYIHENKNKISRAISSSWDGQNIPNYET